MTAGAVVPAIATHGLRPPVDGEVLARFVMTSRYGPGHRGVDLAAPLGTPVGASATGTVTFAGSVAGARWVTVDHGPVRTTVGPLSSIAVAAGQQVTAGAVLGTSGRAHGTPAVHWSARVGDRYVDPLAPIAVVASLVPVDATAGSPVPSTAPGAAHRAFARPARGASPPHGRRRAPLHTPHVQ